MEMAVHGNGGAWKWRCMEMAVHGNGGAWNQRIGHRPLSRLFSVELINQVNPLDQGVRPRCKTKISGLIIARISLF
jgi:hypothetical protein